MSVKQVSVFIENKEGKIAELTEILAKGGINIRTLTVADTTNFGILRLITGEPERAAELLKKNGYTASLTEVVAVEVPDVPGGLWHALDLLGKAGISVEYIYSYMSPADCKAILILRVDDEPKTVDILGNNGYPCVDGDRLYGGKA